VNLHILPAPLWHGLFVLALVVALARPATGNPRYVCLPCGLPCDTTQFAAPGICPACGMTLVEAGSKADQPTFDPDQKKVAILVFNGVEILDYTGPYEMFGAANCDVYTVAATRDPVTTAMGMTVVPKYTFADAPQPDVLVVPGGGVKGACASLTTIRYVKATTAHTRQTMSVCNGAFILATAGLLDGLTATTTNGNIPKLAAQFPTLKVVRDQRYVDNGHIVTTAGLSAGIDGALHVIAKLFGTGYAQAVALGEEYDWRPEAGFARAALADQQIPQLDMDALGQWKLVRTEGNTSRWDVVVGGRPKLSATDVMAHIEEALEKEHWKKLKAGESSPTSRSSRWSFTGRDGKFWYGTLKLDGAEGAGHDFTAGLSIARSTGR